MAEVIFKNLRTGFCLDCNLDFNEGRFIPDPSTKSIKQSDPPKEFQNIESVAIKIPEHLEKTEKIQQIGTWALEKFHDIAASVCAEFQTDMYLEVPVTFSYKGKDYLFHEEWVENAAEFSETKFIGGGNGCSDLGFLKDSRKHRLFYDFYREAQNDSNRLDYRALQLWRFFEGWFNLKELALVYKIVGIKTYERPEGYKGKISKRLINGFYRFSRCAVAHGGGVRGNQAKKIIIPRRAIYDKWLVWHFHDLLEIANYILRKNVH